MSERRKTPLDKLVVPAHELPIPEMYIGPRPVHPVFQTVKLPPIEELPGVATRTRISTRDVQAGDIGWSEYLYTTRERVYRDAIALVRGHLWRESGADKITRSKWIVRRIKDTSEGYSFGLPLVELQFTEWSHVEFFDGKDREHARAIQFCLLGLSLPAQAGTTAMWSPRQTGVSPCEYGTA